MMHIVDKQSFFKNAKALQSNSPPLTDSHHPCILEVTSPLQLGSLMEWMPYN